MTNTENFGLPESLTATQFAQLCGVAQSTVSSWLEAGMPHEASGRGRSAEVPPARALQWIVARTISGGSQRERLAREQADKLALQNAQKRGKLILVEHVHAVMLEANTLLAGLLDGLPGHLAGQLAGINDPSRIRTLLLDEHRRIRTSYAAAMQKMAEADHAPGEESTPGTNE